MERMQVLVHLSCANGANQVEQVDAVLNDDGKVYARLGSRWWMLSRPGTLGWRSFNVGIDSQSDLSKALTAFECVRSANQPDAQGIRPSDLELTPLDPDETQTVPLTEDEIKNLTEIEYDRYANGGN